MHPVQTFDRHPDLLPKGHWIKKIFRIQASSYICRRMTSSFFTYNKSKVLQALRFHFISRKEIKFMIILVNVFAILSAVLSFLKIISPFAFILSSLLWFVLMISFWYILPMVVYKRAATFKETFKVSFEAQHMFLENERGGSKSWPWTAFSTMMESPHFFHLYFNSRAFFLIPKNAFEDIYEVRKFLKQKIGAGRH